MKNPSPPWVHADVPDPSQDPRFGYYTRWAGNAIAVFLPHGAEVQGQATIRSRPFKPIVRPVLDRSYFYRKVMLEPGGQAILKVTYRVPNAATVDGDSSSTASTSTRSPRSCRRPSTSPCTCRRATA